MRWLQTNMRLVVDASTLVAEVLRTRGRKLLAHPGLDLFIAKYAWNETEHELRKRIVLLAETAYTAFVYSLRIRGRPDPWMAEAARMASIGADRVKTGYSPPNSLSSTCEVIAPYTARSSTSTPAGAVPSRRRMPASTSGAEICTEIVSSSGPAA